MLETFRWLSKLGDSKAEWKKSEANDAIHWFRQAVGFVLGFVLGVIPLVGGVYLAIAIALNFALTWLFYSRVLQISDSHFEETSADPSQQLLQQGAMPSFAMMLVTWTITYTLLH
eukprot:c3447_g1_i1.p1 GENE.c3447_g1_i1~~c3447_g1_i1.p1  ORF type:complete len:115 (-),score=23.41 c3447_g1_i1:24-368(-)